MDKTHLFIALLILSFFTTQTRAQYTLSGQVADAEDKPLSYATTILLTGTDSVMVKGANTNQEGRFAFENIAEGTYRIAVSMVGYESTQTAPFTVQPGFAGELPVIVLKEGVNLEEVTVSGTKPLFEMASDRMIMNVSDFPSMDGNTGLELLQKVPGLIVDRQNSSLSMNVKGEVLVMINGKIQRMPGEVLMAKIQGMRAENIEQIEIIDQSPAKYDASGAAGIINIVLKKNEQQGTNGSVSLTGGYGQREKAGASLNLNSRKGKVNWYGGYNFNWNRADKYEINHFREYEYQGDDYYFENFVTLGNYKVNQHTANMGLDIDFNGQTVIGFLVGGTLSELVWGEGADSQSFSYVNDELSREADYLFGTKTDMSNLTANVNLLQKIGTSSSLNFNLDYAKIRYENSGDLQHNDDPEQAIAYERDTPMEFWIVGVDNTNELGDAWTLETGVKGTFNNTLNTTSFQSLNDEDWENPDLFASTESIREQILAAYLSFNGKLSEKLDAELGLRYEHYTYRLDREELEDVENVFSKPFPVVRLNYKIDSVNTLQLGFNRSITRPSFFHLTSFLALFDPSLIVYANPQLQPTFTNTVKVSWQRNSAIFSLSYLSRTNQIYFYNTVDKENHLQTSFPTNLDQERIIEANLSFPLSPVRWWEMSWNLNAFYHEVEDKSNRPAPFENDIFTFAVQLNTTFMLGNDWSIGVDGRYMSPYLVGDQRLYSYPYLNLAVRKKFSSGSSLSISVQDITNTAGKEEWEYQQPEVGIRTFGDNDFSERQIRVTYTHMFGNQKLSGKRQRKTGSDDVKNRM